MATKRAGKTVKVSISLAASDVATLKRRARESYGGNLSAAFGEAARWIRQREARRRLVSLLGGEMLTPELAARRAATWCTPATWSTSNGCAGAFPECACSACDPM